MITYSVIIPHKNSQDTLAYCLSTIPVREDVQVIVVDDNSDADKVDFDNFPQWDGANYECYLTKEGKGAGYARNVGLDHANGKWVLFVDADDYLLPTIGRIFDEEVSNEADVIYYRMKAVMLEDRTTPSGRGEYYNVIIDEYLATGNERRLRTQFYSPTCKIVKMSLIREHRIRFDEIRYSNDNHYSAQVGCYAKRIAVRDEAFYVATQSGNSLTSNFGQKEGERVIRADALLRTCEVVTQSGYEVDFKSISIVISPFLFSDRKRYRYYFRSLMKMGYSKRYLTQHIFSSPKWKARTWRRLYSYLMTSFV